MIARQHAQRLRLIAPEPSALADYLRVRVFITPMDPDFREFYLPGRGIAIINANMTYPERRWYLAHALGHAVLHVGDHSFLLAHCPGVVPKQESQSERFAAFYLAPTLTDIFKLPPDKRLYRVWLEGVCGVRAA